MGREAVLRAEDIHKSYGNLEVLKGVSFEIRRGETKVIAGPSGAGKSTLLRCLNPLTKPDKGRVWLEDVELTDPSVDINKMRQKRFVEMTGASKTLDVFDLNTMANGYKYAAAGWFEPLDKYLSNPEITNPDYDFDIAQINDYISIAERKNIKWMF